MDLFGEENESPDHYKSSFEKGGREGELVLNKDFAKAYEDRKSKEELRRLVTESSRFGGDDAEDEDR